MVVIPAGAFVMGSSFSAMVGFFGMNMAGDNLQKAFGNQMRTILGKLASNRVMSVIVGTVASGVLQSSSDW